MSEVDIKGQRHGKQCKHPKRSSILHVKSSNRSSLVIYDRSYEKPPCGPSLIPPVAIEYLPISCAFLEVAICIKFTIEMRHLSKLRAPFAETL